ncbi:MAG: tRNA epoxyqueuosine(34) reductase QueG [Phycisphaerales bacterium]
MSANLSPNPESPSESDATRFALALCESLQFALAGVAPAAPVDHAEALRNWLGAGLHGEMSWMDERVELRIDPGSLLPGARSILVVADRYADGRADEVEPGKGRVARYARGDDYHRLMKKRLFNLADRLRESFPGHEYRVAVDTAPVLEREHAARAGLGYTGKNTMLIEPGVGSYLLLGEIITTLPLEVNRSRYVDHCGSCVRCIEACPTDAITPYRVDATKCLSYLTIEHRSPIDERYHAAFGDWIFGCDICQEVCPHNGDTPRTRDARRHPAYEPRHESFDLLEVLGWTEDDRREAFVKSAMKRAKLDMMKRNALIAAGNAISEIRDERLLDRIRDLAHDESESDMVRDTARATLERIFGASS